MKLPDYQPQLSVLWRTWTFHLYMSVKITGPPVAKVILVGHVQTPWFPSVRAPLHALLSWRSQSHSGKVVIDLGADESFIHRDLVELLGIPTHPLSTPVVDRAMDGRSISRITQITVQVELQVSGNHCEYLQLFPVSSPDVPAHGFNVIIQLFAGPLVLSLAGALSVIPSA